MLFGSAMKLLNSLNKCKIFWGVFKRRQFPSVSALQYDSLLNRLNILSVCYYHVTCEVQSESAVYSLPECHVWTVSLNGWVSVCLQTKWLWVRIPLLSLKNFVLIWFCKSEQIIEAFNIPPFCIVVFYILRIYKVKIITFYMNLKEIKITHNRVSLFKRFFTCITTQIHWNIHRAKKSDNL